MSVPATIRAMRAAGVDPQQMIDVAYELAIQEEEILEEKKAKARAAQAKYMKNKKPADISSYQQSSAGNDDKVSPTPPSKKILPPSDIPLRGDISSTPHFIQFWEAYPRKTAKRAAQKAHASALKRSPPAEILAGAERYATERADEDQKFTAHASTWLNADRWRDEATPTFCRAPPPNPIAAAFAKVERKLGIQDEPASQTINITPNA